MSDLLASLESVLSGMKPENKAELIRVAQQKLKQKWLPNPGPQTQAYLSQADWLLYGGAAGGGKTDLLLGLAITQHQKAVIFRQAFNDMVDIEERFLALMQTTQGWRGDIHRFKSDKLFLEFGALEKPRAEFSWQGRAHDFYGFDEGAQLTLPKVLYVTGWLRSVEKNIRKRVVVASNPPMGGEGEWIIEWWAPWLDPNFPDPATPGELRWAIVVEQRIRWVDGPGKTFIKGREYTHESYTFIPALLDDNPYLKDTGYRGRIENMPEPLRSQLLYGDFAAGREDHQWQTIPTAWVLAANERWRKAEVKHRTMIALAADIAMGGVANTVLAPLYEDAYFGQLIKVKGVDMNDPSQHAVLMVQHQRDQADLSVDATGGWGIGVVSHLKIQHQIAAAGLVFSKGSTAKAKGGKLAFKNLRAQMWWQFREALDPESGVDMKLPVDPRLLAQLTTPRYEVHGTNIVIEDKEDVEARVGSTIDEADAVIMAWHRRGASIRKARTEVAGLPPIEIYQPPISLPGRSDNWLLNG